MKMENRHFNTDDFRSNEVDHIIRNAELRDAIEPYMDEAIFKVDTKQMPTESENEFLESMLAWERAPILPVAKWFEPELVMENPDTLGEFELHTRLHTVILLLFEKRIVLEHTDHLSDRDLYCLIMRDILPSFEKRIDVRGSFLQWQCMDPNADEEIWLTYYATDKERETYFEETGLVLPMKLDRPFPREIPKNER